MINLSRLLYTLFSNHISRMLWSIVTLYVLLAVTVVAANFPLSKQKLIPRQSKLSKQKQIQKMSELDPIKAAHQALNMDHVKSNHGEFDPTKGRFLSGLGDEQLPWFEHGEFDYYPVPNATQGDNGGWSSIPHNFHHFDFKTDLKITGGNSKQKAYQPYYVSSNINEKQVKRAVLVLPGAPRDSWRYANQMNNALHWAEHKQMYGIKKGDVMIMAPIVLNNQDQDAGSVQGNNWAVYHGSTWEWGGSTISPKLNNPVSFYVALDKMIERLMDKSRYPNLQHVVVAGHSMGGKSAMRYAIIKRNTANEDRLKFWISNPGSYTYLDDSRPLSHDNCKKYNDWPYGLGTLPKYAHEYLSDHERKPSYLRNRFLSRDVQFTLGLLDNQPSDHYCQGRAQGNMHLDAGSYFAINLGKLANGFPRKHALRYVAGVGHQEYPLYGTQSTMDFIFGKNFHSKRSIRLLLK